MSLYATESHGILSLNTASVVWGQRLKTQAQEGMKMPSLQQGGSEGNIFGVDLFFCTSGNY